MMNRILIDAATNDLSRVNAYSRVRLSVSLRLEAHLMRVITSLFSRPHVEPWHRAISGEFDAGATAYGYERRGAQDGGRP
jgi:hypothetical protein